MFDAVRQFSEIAQHRSDVLQRFGLALRGFLLATVHRPYNVDNPENLRAVLRGFIEIGEPVVLPAHPHTKQRIAAMGASFSSELAVSNIRLVDQVGYLDMLVLQKNARVILIDSGGVQKEAFFCDVPCVTLRPETEWVELLQIGVNMLAGGDPDSLVRAYRTMVDRPISCSSAVYGYHRASEKIMSIIETVTA